MSTNYDNEATQFADNESTQFADEATQYRDNESKSEPGQPEAQSGKDKDAKMSGWKKPAAAAAGGIVIGGLTTVLMGSAKADAETTTPETEGKDTLSHPEWVDDEVAVATGVSDDMSFGEAFAAARAEVGPGGCFEWHGGVYGTYTADEWNHMSAAERAEYSDHFSWGHLDHSTSNVAQHSSHPEAHTAPAHTSTAHATAPTGDDDIEVISVNHGGETAQAHHATHEPEVVQVNAGAEPEVEILGVVHDSESGMNFGGMMVDNQEVVLIDVDGNMEFDLMASDLNHNGQFDQDEVVDIQGQGFTVDSMGGFSNPTGDLMASDDILPDYSSDPIYEA